MYRVEFTGVGDTWQLSDEAQTMAFVGTKRQAEDWLDFQENAQRQAASSPSASYRHFVDGGVHSIQGLLTAFSKWLGKRLVIHH